MMSGYQFWMTAAVLGLIGARLAASPAADPTPQRAEHVASLMLTHHAAATRYAAANPAAAGPVAFSSLAAHIPSGYAQHPAASWTTCIAAGSPRRVATWTTALLPSGLAGPQIAAALATLSDSDPGAGVVDATARILPADASPIAFETFPAGATCGSAPTGAAAIISRLQ